MSKVFEALQRLERDSGKLPPGVLLEAQQIFESGGSAAPESAVSIELDEPELSAEPNLMAEPSLLGAKPPGTASHAHGSARPIFRSRSSTSRERDDQS